MGRSASKFRQQDVRRAITAARQAGLKITRVEIDVEGRKITVIGETDGGSGEVNSWADASTDWLKRRGKGAK